MKSIDEQTILVTGSTDGIGKITALKLAGRGARVLVHGRNQEKVRRVADEIRKNSSNNEVEEYTADFSSLDNVRTLAENLRADHQKLDVLINNAGLGFSNERQVSEDGYELRFAVNYLAPFLLTHLLLTVIENAASSRIVNVSSAGQQAIDFDDVMLEKEYDAWRAYRQSKLALIMFTFKLAEQLDPEIMTVNCLHPGTFLRTKMVTEEGINPLGEPETGAAAEIYVATSPELEKVTGKYFDQKSEAKANAQAYDKEARQKLWKLSKQYTGV